MLAGAGDIAMCGVDGANQTARLLDRIAGGIFTTGDNAYPSGTDRDFAQCYDPTWGRHRERTHPTPGNHEYEAPGAVPYFAYFGANAGPPGRGYYAYTAGAWQVIALNSAVDVGPNSAQLQWLRNTLTQERARCAIAYWHRPLFSSAPRGGNRDLRDLWRVLYEFGVEIVVVGHDHFYERFAPQTPDGSADPARGIRQFTVGTGGAPLTPASGGAANSEVSGSVWGVLVLTLNDGGYAWEFRPVAGASFTDAGSGTCH